MILGPQPQITQMVPQQQPQQRQPLLGGQPVQGSPLVASLANQVASPNAPAAPASPLSGVNMSLIKNAIDKYNAAQQPNTPGQTFQGMMNAGATPSQALQVTNAPNGATSDYAAGYTGPDATPPGTLAQIYGALASMFGSGGTGGSGQ